VIVVDANIIAYLFIPGIHTASAEKVFLKDNTWAAPVLWRSEMRSVLLGYVRQKHMDFDIALEIMEKAHALIAKKEHILPSEKVMEYALKSGCTVYDCEYVVLAHDLKMPLVTTDSQILRSFPQIAISPTEFIV
jgi:predicted nucleic acid-binding protein